MKKTMKRVVAFATFAMMTIALNAQVKAEGYKTISGDFYYIPAAFTYEGYLSLTMRRKTDDVEEIDIYNENFELVKTLSLKSYTEWSESLYFMDLDNNSSDIIVKVSQKLFNSDEKYEYIASIYEDPENSLSKRVGFRIMSEDGTQLQSVMFDETITKDYSLSEYDLYKINGKYYLFVVFKNIDEWHGSMLYLIYEVDSQTTEVKAVKNIPVASPVRHYSMDGRQLDRPRRGINITQNSNGTVTRTLVK